MCSQNQFSEKIPNFSSLNDSDNMTTIDLNSDNRALDSKEKSIPTKFKVYNILKSLLLVIGLFILLGLCASILILLIVHRGYFKNDVLANTTHFKESTFQILLTNKEKISACKISKSYEDCCNILSSKIIFSDLEKCTVEKVLKFFFQYELEANKRFKRQNYDVLPDYLNENINWGNLEEHYWPHYEYQNDEHIPNYDFYRYADERSFVENHETNLNQNFQVQVISTTSTTKKPNYENTAKNSHSSENNKRVSQGTDFEIKPQNENQNSQTRQVTPCVYPISQTLMQPYPISLMPVNSNIQQQPLYVINPQVYPSIPMHYPQAPILNKNSIQVAGAGGQYYLCNPILNQNSGPLQGVEVRQNTETFSLQDLVNSSPKISRNNKTREAIDCPLGSQACSDNSKCIHSRQICDNEIDCNDASDEMDCSCRNRVGELRWCDGYLDCPNGEDEQNCFDCRDNEISCDDWSRFQHGTCVPISQKCDGIKDCEITGKDEEDCSILTDHLAHHALFTVSNAAGFLHRNYKGKWYPTCFGANAFAVEVCKTEAGPTEIIPNSQLVPNNDNYVGSFVDFTPNVGISIVNSCLGSKAAYVECPPLFCGLRLTINNPFRTAEVDISAEDFLSKVQRRSKNVIVGKPRVVGGKPSQPTAWPWVVSIYKNGVFHCGGVLVSDMWVLTAAHCVDRFWLYFYEVQAGILRRFSYAPMEQTRFATFAIPHENYNKKSLKNDIALMKLSKPVRFNRYVRPICLPSAELGGEDFHKGPKPNTVCVTVGWGATVEHGSDPDHLREVEVPIMAQCKHTEDKEGDEICAGLLEGGRDACQGDSGGPLMCPSVKNKNQWYLAGIVSHGEGCARPNEPGVYTKVSKYLGWINANINGKIGGQVPLSKCPGYVCFGTKKCIPKRRHCDKIVDCLFGDDEFDCWQSHNANFKEPVVGSIFSKFLNLFHLNSRTRDEEVLKNETVSVKKAEKIKNNDNFRCQNLLQVIPQEKKCDRIVNCEDGSDEMFCTCADYLKNFNKQAICDGIIDCRDMSDEINCVKCSRDHHLCRISQKCIPLEKRCDGVSDCLKAEDEWDCVALTDGRALVLDSDLRPKQNIEGIITINRFGVWRPLCTNASLQNGASIAENVCNLLEFQEYTVFHKLKITDKPLDITIAGFKINEPVNKQELNCGGLYIRCLNNSLIDTSTLTQKNNFTQLSQFFSFPFNSIIFIDGYYKCTGTILNSHFIIAPKTCIPISLQNKFYIAALLGKGLAHLDVEGPHEQIIKITHIAFVNNSSFILLHSQEQISFNRYVQPTSLNVKARFRNEQCVAAGFHDKKTEFIVLEGGKDCPDGFKCFKVVNDKCENGTFSGIITCKSRDSWYVAAVYDNLRNSCSISNYKFQPLHPTNVKYSQGGDLIKIETPECKGFRCLLGECISNKKICDGVSDCRNSEDEDPSLCLRAREFCHLAHNCSTFSSCSLSEMQCPNGKCILKSSFCNTINDCGDFYDEPEECSCQSYVQRIHPEKICDGTVNCWDRSDEKNCECQFPTNITCPGSPFCISEEMVCDGFSDCPKGEDENHCYSLKTNLENVNSGEVLKRTAGVWHSGCFAQNSTTTYLEKICEKLGFSGTGARSLTTINSDYVTMKPEKDRFDVVWIHRDRGNRLWFRFRTGNEPYLKFVNDLSCFKLFIECI